MMTADRAISMSIVKDFALSSQTPDYFSARYAISEFAKAELIGGVYCPAVAGEPAHFCKS